MNRQSLLDYLDEPSKLYQLSLTELQGLVLEYPYAPNLRMLLLLKSRMEDHPRKEEMLQQAAARTFDREHLYQLLLDLEREEAQVLEPREERLELQDLDQLDFNFVQAQRTEETAGQTALENPVPAPTPPLSPVEEEDASELLDVVAAEVPLDEADLHVELAVESTESDKDSETTDTTLEADTFLQVYPHVINTSIVISSVLADWHASYRPPAPMAPERFVEVEEAATPLRADVSARLKRHRRKQLQQLKTARRDRLKEIVQQSVSTHDEVASETLARLLTQQGQYAKAIKMYGQLGLLYPEKKANFAGLIKELKEKL